MKEKIFSRELALAWLAAFFDAMVFYLLFTTMALYTTEHFHASASISGLISSIYVIGSLFGRLFAGRFLDVVGRKRLTLVSFLIYFLSTVGYLFASNMGFLLAIRCIHGITFGISSTGVMTIAMTVIPDSRKGEGAGYFGIAPTLGTALGPFVGTFLLRLYNYQVIFGVCVACAALCLLFVSLMHIKPIQLSETERREATTGILNPKKYFESRALPISLCLLVMAVCYSSVLTFVTSFAWELDLAVASSFFFLIYALFLVFGRPTSGRLLDRRGSNIVMYPALILLILGFLLLSFTHNWYMLLISAVLFALGYGTPMSSIQAIAVKLSPVTRYSLALSTVYICADVGTGLGPVLMGGLINAGGYRFTYRVCAVIVVLCIILYYFLHGRNPIRGSLNKS